MEFLAKHDPPETIESHTKSLMKNYEEIKRIYPNIKYLNWEILKLSCLYHDLGKINSKFQNKLIGKIIENSEIDEKYKKIHEDHCEIEVYHNYLSPAFLPYEKLSEIYSENEIRILARSIFKHHRREETSYEEINLVLEKDIKKNIEFLKFEELKEIDLSEGIQQFRKYTREIERKDSDIDFFYEYVITQGLLNKIDRASSSCIKINKDKKIETMIVEVPNKDLTFKVTKMLEKLSKQGKNELQRYLEENKDENNIVVASTGVGKTEAGLLWIGDNKGFFSLPMKVSVNGIYERIKNETSENNLNYIGYNDVGLLHSDIRIKYTEEMSQKFENGKNENDLEEYIEITKQFSLPLTICTLDQLIDFVYMYEGFEIKLATLSYSKLIIDEIQMYTADYLGTLLVALKYITDVGGKFTIMTATLPPIIEYYIEKKLEIKYKKPKKAFLKKINRHKMKSFQENINVKKIIENYENKKVLVICNTVKKAQEIYLELKKALPDHKINLLHSRFIRKDRRDLENRILKIGSKKITNGNEIWVTTQIVECSLDLDFDVLYTELSDLSGFIQRMGRVYRDREIREEENFNVYLFLGTEYEFPSGVKYDRKKSVIDIDLFEESRKTLLEFEDGIITEEKKIELVEKTYTLEKLKKKGFYQNVETRINNLLKVRPYLEEKMDINLREIETVNIIPKSVFEENKKEIKRLKDQINGINKKETLQQSKYVEKLKDYFVPVYPYMIKNFVKNLQISSKINNINIYDIEYDSEVGIKDGFKKSF